MNVMITGGEAVCLKTFIENHIFDDIECGDMDSLSFASAISNVYDKVRQAEQKSGDE